MAIAAELQNKRLGVDTANAIVFSNQQYKEFYIV
jgi:hypothetical protein